MPCCQQVLRPLNHRKLVQYYGYGNMVDDNGHGTHVCGTVAGSPIIPPISSNSSLNQYVDVSHARGVAPLAKIAFFDIFDGNAQNALVPPPDLVHDYLQVQYDAGVRIESDSWGFVGTFIYSDSSSQVSLRRQWCASCQCSSSYALDKSHGRSLVMN